MRPLTHYPDRGARGADTYIMEFATGLPVPPAPLVTYRMGRKWFDRLVDRPEIICVPAHGGAGREFRAKVESVELVEERLVPATVLLALQWTYPAREPEWTRISLWPV